MLTSPSGKVYNGQTIRPIHERFKEHQEPDSGCPAIAGAIEKHGWEKFITDYYECPDEDLNKYERWMIRVTGSLAPGGYNLTEGGSNGRPCEITRQKMSDSKLGEKNHMYGKTGEKHHFYGKTHTEESKKHMSESMSGPNHPMYGKTLTEDHKKKLSESMSGPNNPMYGKTGEKHHFYGKTHTEATKKHMSESLSGPNHPMYGKTHTEEAKKHMSEAHTGENNGMYGKAHTEDAKKKMSEAKSGPNHPMYGKTGELHNRSKKVYQYTMDGTFVRPFGSVREAAGHLKKHPSHISSCANGKLQSAHKFRWSYEEKEFLYCKQ